MAASITLLSAVAATGAGQSTPVQNGGDYMFAVAGTIGGATIALEMLGPDGASWINMGASATFTTNNMCVVSIPEGRYRANVTGGAGPYLISASLKAIV